MATEEKKVRTLLLCGSFMIRSFFNAIIFNFCIRSRTISTSRYKTLPKTKSRKKKKRKRIIESDNQSENEESNDESKIEMTCQMQPQLENNETIISDILDVKLDNVNENNEDKHINQIKNIKLPDINSEISDIPATLPLEEITQQKKKKVNL